VCNHRVYDVLIVSEASVITGLLTGMSLAAFGMPPLAATGAGGAALAFVFGAAMSAVSYIRRQDS
jgi:hypothetical protein